MTISTPSRLRIGLGAALLALAVTAGGATAQMPPGPPVTESTPAWVAFMSPGSHLSMRAGPGTGFGRMGTLPMGAPVTILARMGNWMYVDAGGMRGFVSGRFLSAGQPPMGPAPGTATGPAAPGIMPMPMVGN